MISRLMIIGDRGTFHKLLSAARGRAGRGADWGRTGSRGVGLLRGCDVGAGAGAGERSSLLGLPRHHHFEHNQHNDRHACQDEDQCEVRDLRHPGLQISPPAHTQHPGWCADFGVPGETHLELLSCLVERADMRDHRKAKKREELHLHVVLVPAAGRQEGSKSVR